MFGLALHNKQEEAKKESEKGKKSKIGFRFHHVSDAIWYLFFSF